MGALIDSRLGKKALRRNGLTAPAARRALDASQIFTGWRVNCRAHAMVLRHASGTADD
jgi:hypothetical protein